MADVVRAGNREEAKAVVRPAFYREIADLAGETVNRSPGEEEEQGRRWPIRKKKAPVSNGR